MHVYRQLSPQPIAVYFGLEGLPRRESELIRLDKLGELDESTRSVYVKIRVSGVSYGPFTTDIQASPDNFIFRRSSRLTPEQRDINKAIKELDRLIVKAWSDLLPVNDAITGGLLWWIVKKGREVKGVKYLPVSDSAPDYFGVQWVRFAYHSLGAHSPGEGLIMAQIQVAGQDRPMSIWTGFISPLADWQDHELNESSWLSFALIGWEQSLLRAARQMVENGINQYLVVGKVISKIVRP